MSRRVKRNVDVNTSIPLDRLATPTQISSYIKRIVNASQYDFYETEALEVESVILNETLNHGAVLGTFIDNPDQEIMGGIVLPLMANITNVPLVGEHVVVVEYNEQHYYTSIINRKNNVNENSIPGVSTGYVQNTKYGETFKRQDIRRVKVCEGEIVYEGRFGNSIKLGCNHKNNTPNIRIRAGQQEPPEDFGAVVEENINEDKSSIYLSTDETIELDGLGARNKFPAESVKGNSIVMNSDKIFLNSKNGNFNVRASENLILQGDEIFIHAKSGNTIKMGDPRSQFIPTLNSEVINQLMKDIMFTLKEGFGALSKATNVATVLSAIKDIATIVAKRVPNIVDVVSNEKYLNKQIMIANPNFKIPEFSTGSGKKKKKTLQSSAEDSGAGLSTKTSDGKFDSDNIERPSKRDESGERNVGPRRY